MAVVSRSPFEYLLSAPAGGGIATAFQAGERSASDLETAEAMRRESALRQQEAGLRLEEFKANAPLRAAERDWRLGGMRELSTQFGMGLPQEPAAETMGGLPSWLIGRESGGNFGALNTDTGASGRGQFIGARLEDARRAGIIPANMTLEQFRRDPTAQMRVEQWHVADIGNFIASNGLDRYIGQSIGGVPITANGMLAVAHLGGSGGLKRFLETGGRYNPPDANGTRLSDYLALGARAQGSPFTMGAAQQQGPQPPATPAPLMTLTPGLSPAGAAAPAPAPQLPSMMFAPGAGVTMSPGGVPMTAPQADLPEVNAGEVQAQRPYYVPGAGLVPPPGNAAPAAPGASPFTRLPGTAPLNTPVEPAQPFTDWLRGQVAASETAYQTAVTPGAEPAPSATAPATAPATSAVPFTPTTGAAIGQLPAATSLTALGIAPVGRTPAGAPAAPATPAAPAAPAAQSTGVAGLELIGPARQGLQQIDQQRALLQRRLALARTLAPAEAAKELVAIQTDSIALNRRATELQSDQAIGQMTMGQPQVLDNIFQREYGIRLQPIIANNRVTGYNLLRGDALVATNVTPEALGRQARLALNQTYAEKEAEAALPFRKAQVEAWLDSQKALSKLTADVALERVKQSFPDLAVTSGRSENEFIIADKNGRSAFVVSKTNIGVDGKPLPKGETRWTTNPIPLGAVPTR